MNQKQKQKFLALCKACRVKPVFSKCYEICHRVLINKIHSIAEKERLYDGYYWLIDSWILEFNRISGTTQYASPTDLKRGLAESEQHPVDFLYERLLEIRKYRKKGWIKKGKEEYDDY